MTGWRAFIGMWDDGDPDWTTAEHYAETWAEARDWLAACLRKYDGDPCPDCEADAATGLTRLMQAAPGVEWFGSVEGDDYILVRA